ncbi:MAG: metallophosphoesterase [Candidatus Accumulibacter sp.]|uniref:metallophosphoesterase family protein n=1 Tax=Accumulibacter sp. TaxID=2053492 RepID=UPI00258D4331|nr:metallophosphoesterase family protein [Accumulibacter sp.]MBK8116415.1 metallophosphoesterase [Accumulibacter sp.]
MTYRLMCRPLQTLLAGIGLLLAGYLHAETWRFAVIGDTPYNEYERRELPRMLDDIAAENPSFIVHAGDFKEGKAVCSDELFIERRMLFDTSSVPLLYVPGDNEWTDCRRLPAGHFDPVERLQKLRETFFATPRSLGSKTLPVERQAGAYPEHLRWRLGPVLFVSLNVPGPDNNYGLGQAPSDEFLARNPVLIDWLRQGFATARREHAAGMVIVMQANPGFRHHAAGLTHAGFRALLEVLSSESLAFPGQVLLVHGDTHWQRIDHPLRDPSSHLPIANFTRLETFGYPLMGWVKVIVDDEHPRLFRFEVHPYRRR